MKKSKALKMLEERIKEYTEMKKVKKLSKLEQDIDNIKASDWYQKYIWKTYKPRSFKDVDEMFKSLNDNAVYQKIYYKVHGKISRLIEAPFDFCRNLKWDIQRAERGYGDCDIWDYFNYIAKVNYHMLVELKKNKLGFPCQVIEKSDKLESDGNLTNKASDDCAERWDKILDKMIYAWGLNMQIGNGDREAYNPRLKNKYKDTYNCLTKEEEKDRLEGLKLYNKFYFSLWD